MVDKYCSACRGERARRMIYIDYINYLLKNNLVRFLVCTPVLCGLLLALFIQSESKNYNLFQSFLRSFRIIYSWQ
jgi:hypothetical protein